MYVKYRTEEQSERVFRIKVQIGVIPNSRGSMKEEEEEHEGQKAKLIGE